jgi:hypothetical protein
VTTLAGGMSACSTDTEEVPAQVVVRVDHVGQAFQSEAGVQVEPMVGPIAWVLLDEDAQTPFAAGSVASPGLEDLAERGDPTALAAELALLDGARQAGAVTMAEGTYDAGAIGPGQSFEMTIDLEGRRGRVWLATMFVQSNDLYLAPSEALSLDTSDETTTLTLWDAGTEVNEAPGDGQNQAPRQAEPDAGTSEAQPIAPVDDGYTYPSPATLLDVTMVANDE